MKKTVVAVIGAGRIADNAHLPALSKIENVRVKYVCDYFLDKANYLKDKYAIVENAVSDIDIVLNG